MDSWCSCCQIVYLHVFSSVLWCQLRIRFPRKSYVRFVWTPFLFCRGFMFYLCYLYFFDVCCYPTQFPYQMRFVWLNSNTTGVACETGTVGPSRAPVFTPLAFYVMFCISLLSFGHCIVCPSIYGFWLPLWYLQTCLAIYTVFTHLLVILGMEESPISLTTVATQW